MEPFQFSPFPILHTPRLLLREPLKSDAEDLFELRSDPEVMRFIPRPLAKTVEDVHTLLDMIAVGVEKGERINWAIEWKETGKVVGLLGFVNTWPDHNRAEVGYSLSRAWHRKGITREALAAVVGYGFDEMKLHSILAIIDAENHASGAVLEDAGFAKEAYFREDFLHNGVYRNSIYYGLLHSDARPTGMKRPV